MPKLVHTKALMSSCDVALAQRFLGAQHFSPQVKFCIAAFFFAVRVFVVGGIFLIRRRTALGLKKMKVPVSKFAVGGKKNQVNFASPKPENKELAIHNIYSCSPWSTKKF